MDISDDKMDELLALRNTVREHSTKIKNLTEDNEALTRDLENTQVLLNLCLDTLKRNNIGLNRKK